MSPKVEYCCAKLGSHSATVYIRGLAKSVIPDSWRISCLTPVSKETNRLSDPAAFRPVAVTSALLKTLKHYVLYNIDKAIVSHTDPCLFTYKTETGTCDALAYSTNDVGEYLNKQGHFARSTLFDSSSAFSTGAKHLTSLGGAPIGVFFMYHLTTFGLQSLDFAKRTLKRALPHQVPDSASCPSLPPSPSSSSDKGDEFRCVTTSSEGIVANCVATENQCDNGPGDSLSYNDEIDHAGLIRTCLKLARRRGGGSDSSKQSKSFWSFCGGKEGRELVTLNRLS
ncbi:unnamed protein product [Soboliphyme baturini]|uniref:Uncharacterized protein n=1 Tax=Soboliphyme baturini TaxID=241478 RepID=A0A183IGZ1_9BILA|nr:unnamed protein product [Soboliphyme baturini]